MKTVLIAAAVATLAATGAHAADIPARPYTKAPVMAQVYDWTGFYVGGTIGGHWSRDKSGLATDPINIPPAARAIVDPASQGSATQSGVIAGLQAGYNLQVGQTLLGFEVDANWLGGAASRLTGFPPPFDLDTLSTRAKTDFLATVRGRLGWSVNRVLVYGTGGLAVGHVKTSDTFTDLFFIDTTSASNTRIGWTVGGGIEYAINQNWSVKGEYLYVDLGTQNIALACTLACLAPNDFIVSHRLTENIVRFGVNYKFGGPVVAKY